MIAKLNSPLSLVLIVTLGAVLLALVVLPGAQAGGVLEVDRTDDNPFPTACTAAPNDCTLRGAISNANGDPGPNTIDLPAGTYGLTNGASGEDANVEGDLDITDDLTINGAGAGTTFIQAGPSAGNGIDRVFHVIGDTTDASISDVTIRNGTVPAFDRGGGIWLEDGSLALAGTIVSDNLAYNGGGIAADRGTLNISGSSIRLNQSGNCCSGILNSDGTLILTDSDVSGNSADKSAGGIGIFGVSADAVATLTNVDIIDNTAINDGAGIANEGGEDGNAEVTLTDVTISGNTAGAFGGAIYNSSQDTKQATVTLDNSTIDSNTAGDEGGGIYNITGPMSTAVVTLASTTVSRNDAVANGGGIANINGDVVLAGSAVENNTSGADGGGIISGYVADDVDPPNSASLTISNSTLSGNSAAARGGGIFSGEEVGTVTVDSTNVTIANNSAPDGGGLFNDVNGALTLKNTIVADSPSGGECSGPITSSGYNLDTDASCGLAGPGDLPGASPMLGPLGSNGGPTVTHALLAGSDAIDAGSPDCPPPATDQRGVARPQGAACDIGALEAPSAATPTPSAAPSATPTPTPSPTPPSPFPDTQWGDDDCNGTVAAVDALKSLQHVAALPFTQTDPCPGLGSGQTIAPAGFGVQLWGDIDCDSDVDAVDALNILRFVAGLPPLAQNETCPAIGDAVSFG